jgi:hypothetical protein
MDGSHLRLDSILELRPGTVAWSVLFQVMPVFFLVGGYANATSWDAAVARGGTYSEWVGQRMRRLFRPVVPFVLAWGAMILIARGMGLSRGVVRGATAMGHGPLWFLVVYALVTLVAPLSRAAGRRLGIRWFWIMVAAAACIDVMRFRYGAVGIAWGNYLLVWAAVHQLGFLWRDGRLDGPSRTVPWVLGGTIGMAALMLGAGYPRFFVAAPAGEASNMMPPSLAMLALGAIQTGLLVAVQKPASRFLEDGRAWAATVWINLRIMTVYIWHITAMVLALWVASQLGGVGLHAAPAGPVWWMTRPLWFTVFAAVLFGLVLVFGRYERAPAARAGRAVETGYLARSE